MLKVPKYILKKPLKVGIFLLLTWLSNVFFYKCARVGESTLQVGCTRKHIIHEFIVKLELTGCRMNLIKSFRNNPHYAVGPFCLHLICKC